MASAKVHMIAGAVVGVVVAAQETSSTGKSPLGLLTSGGFAAFATRLPDVLEPATNPHHRQFFHSWLFGAMIGKLTYDTYRWQPATDSEKLVRYLLLLVGGAYLAHLVLDLGTPRSLPLVGR